MRRSWLSVALLGVTLAVLAGTATAVDDHVTVTAEGGPGTVDPGGAPGTWQLTVTYETPTPLTERVEVDLQAEVGARMDAHVEPSSVAFEPEETTPSQPRYTYTEPATLAVAAHVAAPAYVTRTATVDPEVHAEPPHNADENPDRVTVTPTFRPDLSAEPNSDPLTLRAGEEGHARALLDSLANGDTIVTVEAIDAPDGCELDPLREEPLVPMRASHEAIIHVTCPAEADGGTLTVTYRQAYAYDHSVATTTATAEWDLRVEDEASPAEAGIAAASTANPAGLAGSIGLAALAIAGLARARS